MADRMKDRIDIIPAEPGFYVLEVCVNATTIEHYSRAPIVAWRIVTEEGRTPHSKAVEKWYSSDPFPITPQGDYGHDNWSNANCAILCPDGHVEIPYLASFDNVKAWMSSYLKERKASKGDLRVPVFEGRTKDK